ncbi:MAG: single-stranded-DNA-specific exonuclease RecJ [Leptolyngbyaceae cyanobacterium T60_A2020_046]|nr:single-stranded-DNA-specific exonuclease RecJ [Leptolyngbyaceae cyanobacterium T60_A2020_046]
MPDQRWHIAPALKGEAQWLAQATGLSPVLAQVLLNRGITTAEAAQDFLEPEVLRLPSPLEEFPDLAQSVEFLKSAIAHRQKILICGDYDADGMTSTALLLRALRALGAEVDYTIPSRMQEGYGINRRIIEDAYTDGVSLVLTVDNGIAAVDPIAHARELGLVVIVTDHHDVPPEIPPAHAILNPKLINPASPYRGVAGVGVAYILAVCLAQAMAQTQDLTAPLLELFTLGTIADLAPLTGVNRRWVRRGLKLLPKSRLLGVQALIQVSGLGEQDETLKPEDIGFRLGPRINAVGRISDPQIVIDMLTTDDAGVALERAMQCEQANQSRREMCDRIEEAAIAWCEAEQHTGGVDLLRDRLLLIIQPDWHHGVIGIVASRLVERYGVPVFIGTYEDDAQKEIRGSARGIPEFDVFEALQTCHDLMPKFGGHKAAGGFSFPAKHLRQIKSRLVNYANRVLAPEHLKPLVRVDARAALADLTFDLYEQIDGLHPCGIENPDPVFWTPNVRIVEQRAIGKDRTHLKLSVAEDQGPTVEAIAWRWGHHCPLPDRLDVAYRLKLNEWQGQRTLQIELVGVRPATVRPAASAEPRPAPARTTPAPTLKLPFEAREPRSPQRDRPSAVSPPAMAPSGDAQETPREAAAAPENLPGSVALVSHADFPYSRRRYTARISADDQFRELQIHNPEGQALIVVLPERQGYLALPGQATQPVDVTEPHYFNLIRAALDALELRQKTHLLLEKDELLAEKDRHITTLTQQVALLEEKLHQLSADQQQQFQTLQQELAAQESVIQTQEASIAQMQEQMRPALPPIDAKALKQSVREAVGDKLWFCLQTRSQTDLYAAYKHAALSRPDDPTIGPADYSEAGLRLGFVVEREVVQPFFQDLYDHWVQEGSPSLGSLELRPGTKYTLGMVAPLLADEWQSFHPEVLKAAVAPATLRYVTSRARAPLPAVDRDRLNTFFETWEHPMGQWFAAQPSAAAAILDKISKLRNVSAHAGTPLYGWAFELMRELVLGSDTTRGLFRHIYGG